MPWIKLCGFRDVPTAVAAAEAGADAIGLNFFPPSRRYVSNDDAAEIAKAVSDRSLPVGVFVNEPTAKVAARIESVGLGGAQFHGDEPVDEIAAVRRDFPDLLLIRAFRLGEAGFGPLGAELAALAATDATPDLVLVDAAVPGEYGGTGRTVAWDRLRASYDAAAWPPLVLAGGLTVANVAEALAASGAFGVDVAGGVESPPGDKNRTLITEFIARVRSVRPNGGQPIGS